MTLRGSVDSKVTVFEQYPENGVSSRRKGCSPRTALILQTIPGSVARRSCIRLVGRWYRLLDFPV